jgi:TRAP-type C4-dicarboxylate transport system permease large subunit
MPNVEKILRGIFPFLAALILLTIVLLVFPKIVTFPPGLVS